MEPQINFYTHLYGNKNMLPQLCKISLPTFQPCITNVLIVRFQYYLFDFGGHVSQQF